MNYTAATRQIERQEQAEIAAKHNGELKRRRSEWVIDQMRMLTPRELFRAQGFGDDYIIDRRPDGSPLTKTTQIRLCGNSVCPDLAEALVRANCPDLADERIAA